ncbi:hypothetical protein [Jannaschia seohaensis]|uniref:Hemolysin type calcium-binding protein n=1 Tax=Jannaschia seohaensis TaxID=475081 RepID=A0A2Y9C8G4_9RHOB|nr:hypothetical protein [Jannaschia seohaensis]PWJ16129.1 hypothetical protein BCF38_10913 [Jannaschia seohaensis]SSA49003.1 hypothetical protein SAMN05421539_10913 [Jannaschia seohaensis]
MEIFDAWDLHMIIAPGQFDCCDKIISTNDAPSSSPISGIFTHETNDESDWSGKIASGFAGRFEAPRNAPGIKGDDVFRIAGADNDTIIANGGDDLIRLVSDNDSVLAGAGDDLRVFDSDSQSDADTLDGGEGGDVLFF